MQEEIKAVEEIIKAAIDTTKPDANAFGTVPHAASIAVQQQKEPKSHRGYSDQHSRKAASLEAYMRFNGNISHQDFIKNRTKEPNVHKK